MINLPDYIVPFCIFGIKSVEISLSTLRIIFVSRGFKRFAPVVGFIENALWVSVLILVVKNLNQPLNIIAYAGGFAFGNYIGIWLEERIAIGSSLIRVITQKDADELIGYLRFMGFRVTVHAAESNNGKVKIIFAVVKRRDIQKFSAMVKHFNPKAFYTIEDIRNVSRDNDHSVSKYVRHNYRIRAEKKK